MSFCSFRIDDKDREELKIFCEKRNITVSDLLRTYVSTILNSNKGPVFDPYTGEPINQ